MHIPDGFLDGKTALSTGILACSALTLAVRQTTRHLPARKVPLLGLSAAFVFAAQMINFPVAGGTSGHLIGGVLCATLLGPSAAVVVISCVLTVQCLVFADGGVFAWGANVFNMAVVNAVGGYFVCIAVRRLLPGPVGRLAAVAFASWLMTVLAAVCCTGELAISGTVGWSVALPAMAGVHALIGIGEAVITTLVVFAVDQTRPDLMLRPAEGARKGYGDLVVYGMLIALGIAIFISPFACGWPDGLEWVAEHLSFGDHASAQPAIGSPFSDYQIPGVSSARLATALAGGIGTMIAFVAAIVFAKLLHASRSTLAGDLSAVELPVA